MEPTVFESVRKSPPGSVTTWPFRGRGYGVTQDYPEAAEAASGSAQTRTCAGPPFGPVNAEIRDVNVAVSPRSRRNRDRIHPTVVSPGHLEPRRTATSTQPPANRAATFAKQTEAIKRLEQKRMLPRFSRRFVFVIKWSAIYASSTVATYQDGAALGFSMFFPWGSR
jgi:hypothetical protein